MSRADVQFVPHMNRIGAADDSYGTTAMVI
jgi:hypothetical protein